MWYAKATFNNPFTKKPIREKNKTLYATIRDLYAAPQKLAISFLQRPMSSTCCILYCLFCSTLAIFIQNMMHFQSKMQW